jgi:hypothetical protein
MKKNSTQSCRTVIFTGPSLSPEIAQNIMPDAWIHAPAKCGDILKVIRVNPQRIAIIDGYFEQSASLWHKEILFALSLGIEVYGASSMGALRALELEPYGMKGVGKIFELLKKTQSPDDDEVCLAHTEDFSHQTPPMCNIRATLDKAVSQKQLTEKNKKKYVEKIKALPYYERSFGELSEEKKLINFCLSHYVDQKKEDALSLLNHLSHQPFAPPQNIPPFAPTLFFYKIFREIIATPFDHNYSWLPDTEKKAFMMQQMPFFPAQKRLSKLFHLCYDIARKNNAFISPTRESLLAWASEIHQEYPIAISDKTLAKYLEIYDPCYFFNDEILQLTIQTLKALISTLRKMDWHLYPSHYQLFANYFRQKNSLLNEEQTLAWMKAKKLDLDLDLDLDLNLKKERSGFDLFVEYIAPLHYLIDLNNAHQLGISPSLATIPWLSISETFDSKLLQLLQEETS